MKNVSKIGSVIAALALMGTMAMASQNGPIGQPVVKVEKIGDVKAAVVTDSKEAVTLNKTVDHQKYVARKLYTNQSVEEQILDVRAKAFALHDTVIELKKRKDNQIKDDVQNFQLGADKDTRDILAITMEMLDLDEATHSEQDKKAIAMLKAEVGKLEKALENVQASIPIADTGYALPQGAKISVVGNAKIQAVPLLDGDTVIGHYRVVTGGTDNNDVLINSDSKSYCVAALYITAAARAHDLSSETIEMSFIGTGSYIPGKDGVCQITWDPNPKRSVMPYVEQYNLKNVPGAVDALTWNSTITLSNGAKYPGKNAMVEK